MKISILHPFTSEAAGLDERQILNIHSRPHFIAIKLLSKKFGHTCYMDYFTKNRRFRKQIVEGVTYRFFPVTYKWNGDHKKWKKQRSTACLKEYKKNAPDLTIINMSAHSSPFSYELSRVIKNRNKEYTAMLGGQHYSNNERNREYYKKTHHILVHTQSQKLAMHQMELFKNSDIRVFPLGVDCTIFKPVTKNNDSPILLYVGRIIDWKRIHLTIEALKKLVDNGYINAQLNIIGPVSSEPYFTYLKELILNFKLEQNVNFLGQKEHSALIPFFQRADLFSLPSYMETFGMVMVEAMACGTPVAAINCTGGPADVIEHGKDGILTSPEDYGEEVLNFFKNKKYALEMSVKAREKVVASYSINATYQVLEDSVNSVSNSKAIN